VMKQAHPIVSGAAQIGASDTLAAAEGSVRRRCLAWLPQRRPRPPRPGVSPAVVEEEAANLLYGERTGTVNPSPTVPPLGG
jgi:hypothetical protein